MKGFFKNTLPWFVFFNVLLVSIGGALGWELDWSDEFNYSGKLDSTKWIHEEGFKRNHESQYYTDRLENVRVENGVLILEARKEQYRNVDYSVNPETWHEEAEWASYTSGGITTEGKKQFKYGRLEVRAKMPKGHGVWPAIWSVGINYKEVKWPACGETDIAEYLGRLPYTIHTANHYPDPEDPTQSASPGTDKTIITNPYDTFHVYAIEWYEEEIIFYIDGVHTRTFYIDHAGNGENNPFRKPHLLRLNFALGAWGGTIDDSIFPQTYEIDYVRYYTSPITSVVGRRMAPINHLLLGH